MKRENAIPFRLRIGVTGHRELADPDAIARKVEEFIEKELPDLFDNILAKSQSGGKEKCGCTAGAQPLTRKDGEGLPYRESCR
jgi:hypothetical protein